MRQVAITPIVMAIKTADGQAIILDNGLDTWIRRLQGARVRGIGTGGVMAHGATATMACINTGAGNPVIAELMGGRAANAMAGITEHCATFAKIGGALCHGMTGSGMRRTSMTIKVGGMTTYTLTTSRMQCSAADLPSVGCIMTGCTAKCAMRLP